MSADQTPDERMLTILEELSLTLHLARDDDAYLTEHQSKITHTLEWLHTNCELTQLTNLIRTADLCEEEVILDLLSEPYFKHQ